MTLALLSRHILTLERSVVSADAVGGITRVWQPIAQNIPGTVLTARGATGKAIGRRDALVTHIVLVPQALETQVGDRIGDGTAYYRVHFAADLGDRGSVTAVYVEEMQSAAGD